VRPIAGLGLNPNALLDSLLYRLSVAAVPALIAVISLVAFFAWNDQYKIGGAVPLEMRVLEERGVALTPSQALTELTVRQVVVHHDTRLSEQPFWFSVSVPPVAADGASLIELPSRHALATQCWDAADLTPLGGADRQGAASGQMTLVKAGFALELGQRGPGTRILCRATFSGPARLTALQWRELQLQEAAHGGRRGKDLASTHACLQHLQRPLDGAVAGHAASFTASAVSGSTCGSRRSAAFCAFVLATKIARLSLRRTFSQEAM